MSILPFLAPLLLLPAGLACIFWPAVAPRIAGPAALGALISGIASVVVLGVFGTSSSAVFGAGPLAVQAQLDIVSVTMAVLVAFTGWIVVRFATRYTLGEVWRPRFLGWLLLTLSAVLWLVSAAQLAQMVGAWIAMGLGLRALILTLPARPGAQRAARKQALTGSCREPR